MVHRKNNPLGTVVSCCQRVDWLERKKVSFNFEVNKKRGAEMSKIKTPNGENSISKFTFGNVHISTKVLTDCSLLPGTQKGGVGP